MTTTEGTAAPAPTLTTARPGAASHPAAIDVPPRPAIIAAVRAVWTLAAALAVLAGALEMALVHGSTPGWPASTGLAAGFVYAAAGVAAGWRRPSNRLGVILFLGWLAYALPELSATAVPVLAAVGTVTATLPLAVVVHLLHAFPSGRCRSRLSRHTVAAGYGVCLVLQAPLYLFQPAGSLRGMLAVADAPGLVVVGEWTQRAAGMAVMAVTAVVLSARLTRGDRRQRRVLAPLYGYGIVAVIAVPLVPTVVAPLTGLSSLTVTAVQVAMLTVFPIGFAIAMFAGGFARTGEIQELGAWLGAATTTRPGLVDVLARALGDPSVQLAFRRPGAAERYIDGYGRTVALPQEPVHDGRAAVNVDLDGRPIGAIIYDSALLDDPRVVQAAGRVVALAVEQQRLTAELRASQAQVQRSRARVMDAADRARRRLAQDLHDGLQAELVMLAIQAQRLAGLPDTPPATATAATKLRARIDDTATGLRQLVHGLAPAALLERGLGEAVDDLADRIPIPTRTHIQIGRGIPHGIESAAYYLVAEALSNVVKHARASRIEVDLRQDDDRLTITIVDDGVGGAAPGRGLGLSGMMDRVDTLGGTLRIHSPARAGTRLTVELPCASPSPAP